MLRTHALALPLLIVLALTGCGSPPVALEPEPTAQPLFASDEEALAAAIEVYEQLQTVGDRIGQEGGREPERLQGFATDPYLEESIRSYAEWAKSGYVQIGFSTFRDARVVSRSAKVLILEICEDVGGVDVVDLQGSSIVPVDRSDTLHLEVEFKVLDMGLLVSQVSRLDDLPC